MNYQTKKLMDEGRMEGKSADQILSMRSVKQLAQAWAVDDQCKTVAHSAILDLFALLSFHCERLEYDINPNLDKELLDIDLPLLAHAPGSPNSLLFQGWVQGRLQNEDIVGRGEVDADAAAAHGQQEHCRGRVLLKCLYCLYTSKADAHEVLTAGSVIHVEMSMRSIGTASGGNAVKQSSQELELCRLVHPRSGC